MPPRLNTFFKAALWVAVCILALVALPCGTLMAWIWWESRPPTAARLESIFHEHRDDLNVLADMIQRDENDGFCLEGANLAQAKAAIPSERMALYRATMERAQIACLSWSRDDASVEEVVWGFGVPGTLTERGFRRGGAGAQRIVSCLDEPECYPADRKRREVFVRPMEGSWMIFAW